MEESTGQDHPTSYKPDAVHWAIEVVEAGTPRLVDYDIREGAARMQAKLGGLRLFCRNYWESPNGGTRHGQWRLVPIDSDSRPHPLATGVGHSLPAGAETTLCCGKTWEELPDGDWIAGPATCVDLGGSPPVSRTDLREEAYRRDQLDDSDSE